jgi:hypothetical protein
VRLQQRSMNHYEEAVKRRLTSIGHYFHGDFCLYCRELVAWYG